MGSLQITLALSTLLAGCSIRHTFQCERDDQCSSATAICQPTGYCSFSDSSCSSGFRYDDLAAPPHAGTCVGDGTGGDGGMDTQSQDGDGDACWPYAATNLDPCAVGAPEPAFDLTMTTEEYELDTGNGQWKYNETNISGPTSTTIAQIGGGNVRVVVLQGFTVAAGVNLKLKGPLPVIIVVHGSSTIGGTIISESGRATSAQCGNGGTGTAAITASGGGGGGGGGFGTDGAAGGNGGGGRTGGALGTASGIPSLAPLRGGCNGGVGGAPDGGGTGADRGDGGGAFAMIVRDTLTVSGSVDARGRGGKGGPLNAGGGGGGGGGGSGGAVFLEAASLTVEANGRVCANGGAGGEGGSTTVIGGDGNDGSCSTTPATAQNTTTGGDGGSGATETNAPGMGGTGAAADSGGGGGGGSVGRIRLRGVSSRTLASGSTITPAAVP